MTITWKDPNIKLHGKLHKSDPYYFRYHYGKQRLVQYTNQYTDRPTENQKASRQAFTALRQEVARQLHDPILKARWQRRFKANNQGYKFLHTYVYAQLKAGITLTQSTTSRDALLCVSPNGTQFHQHYACKHHSLGRDTQKNVISTILILHHHTILPLFLPSQVPKQNHTLMQEFDIHCANV